MANTGTNLSKYPVHLGLNAIAVEEPEFTGAMEWYQGYADRHVTDGKEGRLVTSHTFSEPWDCWEVHPEGPEVVVCLSGTADLIQEIDGKHVKTTLKQGEYAINPPGVWHTADVTETCTMLFITAGKDTQHRPRECATETSSS